MTLKLLEMMASGLLAPNLNRRRCSAFKTIKISKHMKLIRRNGNLIPEFPGIFDNFIGKDFFGVDGYGNAVPRASVPAVNVKEDVDGFEVEVAAPGFSKKDFHVEINNNLLTISSTKETKNEEGTANKYTRKEFAYTSFKRSFTLPENTVDTEKIEARYEDGILTVRIPKREEVKPKPAREIAIS